MPSGRGRIAGSISSASLRPICARSGSTPWCSTRTSSTGWSRTHGADRLCLGTDYPFDMAEPDPVGFHARLEDEARAKIVGLNAAQLLGLEAVDRPA